MRSKNKKLTVPILALVPVLALAAFLAVKVSYLRQCPSRH